MFRCLLAGGLAVGMISMVRSATAISRSSGGDRDITFTLQANLIVLEAEVNGVVFPFILDTGASQSLLTTETADQLGLEEVHRGVGRGAGGDVEMSVVRVESFRVGDHSVSNVSFAVMDLGGISERCGAAVSGVIGFDFLSRFRVTIDYRDQKLILQPYGEIPAQDPSSASIVGDTFEFRGIRLTRPDASWEFITDTPLPEIIVILQKRGSTGKATVQSRTLHGMTLASVVPSLDLSLRAQVERFQEISERQHRVGEIDYHSVEYEGVEDGVEQRYLLAICKPGATLYMIRLQSTADEFEDLIDDFDAIVESFRYT